jgi:hypothetical protein
MKLSARCVSDTFLAHTPGECLLVQWQVTDIIGVQS